MRYFLVDQVTELEMGKRAEGIKCLTLTDSALHDFDFSYPPGLLVESLAQLGGLLVELQFNRDTSRAPRRAVLVQVEKMKFQGQSGPGDILVLQAKLEFEMEEAAQVSVVALCDGETRAVGKLNYSLLQIDSPGIVEQRKTVYKVWTRNLKNPPPIR